MTFRASDPLVPGDIASTVPLPRLHQPPEIYRSDSPSPSRSPSRHVRNFSRSHDPLLRNLSPTSTLRAFTAAASATAGKSEDQLTQSIESATPSERAFGARIAQTCKDVRTWCNEVQSWDWPETFEPPPESERETKSNHMMEQHFGQAGHHNAEPLGSDHGEALFWGSLPCQIVVSCEKRIEEIRDALEDRDVEDLKNHVRNAHLQPRTPYSTHDSVAVTEHVTSNLQRLDDFTALITATILQALPYLSRLYALLDTWSIRLLVLRKVSTYLGDLRTVKQEIEDSWAAIARDIEGGQIELSQIRKTFESLHGVVGKRVSRLGARLDSILDDLEGREEVLPDHWIDAFETLEAAYGDWYMQTEREIMNRDLSLTQIAAGTQLDKRVSSESIQQATAVPPCDQSQIPNGTHSIGLGLITDQSTLDTSEECCGIGNTKDRPLEHAESPVLGSSSMTAFQSNNDGDVTDSDREPTPPPVHRESPRESMSMLPQIGPSRISPSKQHLSSKSSPAPSPARSRHIPILVNYGDKEAVANPHLGGRSTRGFSAPPRSELPAQEPMVNSVRARAAFLNRGLEQTQTLQKSVNSPVRPFEHASQAFTKLFALANSSQHSRSSSASSRNSGFRQGTSANHRAQVHLPIDRSSNSSSSQPYGKGPTQSLPTDAVELAADPVTTAESLNRGDLNNAEAAGRPLGRDAFVTPETHFGFEPSTHESKSTIESAWNSPALSDFPDNWPLNTRLGGEEIMSPNRPIDAKFFEKMFVDSLPASPDGSHLGDYGGDSLVPMMPSDYRQGRLDQHAKDGAHLVLDNSTQDIKHRAAGSKPRYISVKTKTGMLLDTTSTSELTTPVSFQSNLSTPEVRDASAIGYFRPNEVQSSPPISRTSSESFESPLKGQGSMSLHTEHESLPPVMSSEVKTDSPSTSTESDGYVGLNHMQGGSGRTASSGSPPLSLHAHAENSSAATSSGAARAPSLNISIPKHRRKNDAAAVEKLNSGDFEATLKTTAAKEKHTRNAVSGDEQLDRHVSRVLSSLPNRIRFTPAGSLVELPITPDPAKGSLRSRPSHGALITRTSRTNLTLSPAKIDEKSKRFKSSNSEVKLYHLSQEGKEQPIKLYVRLVGEGERVMVRVGGGWADLGEYLRQYADHHGHRTVSDGRLELAGAGVGGNMKVGVGPKVRTPLSRPGSVLERPTSRISQRRRSSLAFAHSFESRSDSPAFFGNRESTMTPTPPSTANASEGTPTSVSTKSGSRPSTADAALSASPASWDGADIGLAGPAGKKKSKELDHHKAKWVEDMIDKAKQASVEKKGRDKTWGGIGSSGGTRRIIYKQK